MMANLWPIILNSIKAKSYTLMILELNLNMIGLRLATFFFKNMLLLGLALLEAKMMANLWPIILSSIKAMSYTHVIIE